MDETCPSDETLAAFLEGGLSGPARSAVEAHVRACAACGELVGQLPPRPDVAGKAEDRYELSTVLGSGGMGDVLKAWDRTLQRWVALKLMRAPEPEMERRFLLEAQAQARIAHENVCRIYEVGRLDGQAYIAMQLVMGNTLVVAAADMTLRQKLDVVAQVAEALHAAHQAGLVHRDVKPSNILVEKRDRRFKAFVSDFGLVRDLEAPSSTAAGQILGTPQYMAPEQATGQLDRIDARTDVYGLGLTLFEVAAGRPVYEGSNKWEVLHKVQRGDPPPLRSVDGSLPRDLEAVVAKALEREPERRYQSAHQFAEELRRVIEGEPTLAQPVGPVGRLARRARRHPTAAAVVTVAVVGFLFAATVAMRTALKARTRAEAAQRFGQRAQAIENRMKYAQLLPPHDLTPTEDKVRSDLNDVRREMVQLGAVARGPGEYALGRGALALGDPEAALGHLQRAWALGVRSTECALAMARASNELYRREWTRVAVQDKKARDEARRKLAAKLRDPAVAALREARGKSGDLPAFAAALIAQTEERIDDAFRLAQKALAEDPFLYEAQLLAAEMHDLLGIQARAEGLDDEADRRFALALMQVREALEVGRSDVRALTAACKLGEDRLVRVIDGKRGDPQAVAREALPACEQAVRIAPQHAEPHIRLGGVHRMLAVDLERHGQDPSLQVELAVRSFQRALELRRGDAQASYGLGLSLRVLGAWQRDHGRDAAEVLERAGAALEEAWRAAPDRLPIRNALSSVLIDAANLDQMAGRDPTSKLDRALRILDEALATSPRSFNLLNTRAKLGVVRALWEEQRGHDPLASLRMSLAALDAAKALKDQALVHFNKAVVLNMAVERHLERGEDPKADADGSQLCARRAIELDPKFAAALREQAAVLRMLAGASAGGRAERLAEARRLLRESLTLEPNAAGAWAELAECSLIEARAALAADRDVRRIVAKGTEEAEAGLAAARSDEQPHLARGKLALIEASQLVRWSRDAGAALARASSSLQQASAIHPRRAATNEALARLHLLRAELLKSSGASMAPELDEAERLAVEAARIKPHWMPAQQTLSSVRARRQQVAGK